MSGKDWGDPKHLYTRCLRKWWGATAVHASTHSLHRTELVFYFYFLTMLCGMWALNFPNQGLNPCSPQWKHWILTTGPLAKSLSLCCKFQVRFFFFFFIIDSHSSMFMALMKALSMSHVNIFVDNLCVCVCVCCLCVWWLLGCAEIYWIYEHVLALPLTVCVPDQGS